MMRGASLAAAIVPILFLLPFGCRNPPSTDSVDRGASVIRGICRVGTSGGAAGGGGQRAPAPEEGVKVIVRDSRGKKTITEVMSGKGGEFEIPLSPGKYQIEAIPGPGLLSNPCTRAVEVKLGEVARIELDVYIIQP